MSPPRVPLGIVRRLRTGREEHVALFAMAAVGLLCLVGPPLGSLLDVETLAQVHIDLGAQPPSFTHPFGTDQLGRDMVRQVLLAGRGSLSVALIGTLITAFAGAMAGMLLGYLDRPGRFRRSWFQHGILTIPWLLVVMMPSAVFPALERPLFGLQKGLGAMALLLGLLFAIPMAGSVRRVVQLARASGWVQAAQAMGVPPQRVFKAHILPEVGATLLKTFFRILPGILVSESLISFLRVAQRKPSPSWGALVRSGATVMSVYPWILFLPALFLVGFCFCSFILARDLEDPV